MLFIVYERGSAPQFLKATLLNCHWAINMFWKVRTRFGLDWKDQMPSDQLEMPWILNTAFSEAAQEEARRIAEEVLQQGFGTRI